MTHILYNLSEEYQIIVELLEENLDDKYNPITIESIRDNLSVKFDRMNGQSGQKTSRENEKIPLHKILIQGYLHGL